MSRQAPGPDLSSLISLIIILPLLNNVLLFICEPTTRRMINQAGVTRAGVTREGTTQERKTLN